ncbi:MAG: hypothetical protein ACE5PV_10745 [Candidatus Poribacteria bacterium]
MELDQFMKELAGDFLKEIIELFYPNLARKLDFSQKKDLNKELYTESPEGEERFVDVLLEVGYKTPPPSVLLVHVESQQRKRFDFPARMLGYQCLIYGREIERERKDSFSLAEFTEWENSKHLLSLVFCNYALDAGVVLPANKRFIAKKEISVRVMLTILSEALYLPELYEATEKRNVEFEATLPDVRIDCLLFLTKEQTCQSKSGNLKELSTINVLHIKAIGDSFTLEHLQTYLGEALILDSSTQIKPSDQVVLLVICSESFPQVLNGKNFEFVPKQDEPWVYMNKNDWFFPVRIFILNEIDLTDENLAIYFPFLKDKELRRLTD